MMNMIWVAFQKEGIHCYPAALTDPNLSDVSFLGHPHRHMFHFKVWIEVFHNERDLEFIQFKRWCENRYHSDPMALRNRSCETIADDLHAEITLKYPGRRIRIEVAEDGENGAYKEYE